MEIEKGLFSVIIVSYNNYKYIYEAIGSVMKQTHQNIELIISNDGSLDFDKNEVVKFIEDNNTGNIKHYFVNNNETNLGTVKNVNKAIDLSSGEYIFLMAADDALYDETVVEKFVKHFKKLGDNALVITSQTAMCADTLDIEESLALDDMAVDIIKTYTPDDMFKHLSHTYTIPATSTCYRRSFYDKVGKYDEDYYLIEDAPQFIRMSRMGVKAHYLDIIAAKHRDGGISHGNKNNTSVAYGKYLEDEIRFYEKEVFPYADILGKTRIDYVKKKHAYVTQVHTFMFKWPKYSAKQKIMYMIKASTIKLKESLRTKIDCIIQFSFDLNKLKNLLSIGFMTFIISVLGSNYFISTSVIMYILKALNIFSIIIVGLFCVLMIINILYRLYRFSKKAYILLKKGIEKVK